MTTKPEMTLENVCFQFDGSKEAKECIKWMNDKWSARLYSGIIESYYYINESGTFNNQVTIPLNKTLVSPSDYLLLLSAPESQAHLLTEKDRQREVIKGLVSQPPVMEGKEETLVTKAYSRLINAYTEVIKNNSELGILATDSLNKVAELEKENLSLQSEVEQLKELIEVKNEYEKLLSDEIAQLSIIGHSRGWKSSRSEKGEELRNKIKLLSK